MNPPNKYSDELVDWLAEFGYTHCFFVAGGNIMHLLDSVRSRMECVPFVHEVGAAIAAEYFNASVDDGNGKAFVLVTAGPGLTNAVTAIAGAWQESRELLVIGGQVKTTDLALGKIRQRGIQEIDGVDIVKSISKYAKLVTTPLSKQEVFDAVTTGLTPRMGPVFLEICLDVQAAKPTFDSKVEVSSKSKLPEISDEQVNQTIGWIADSERPVILIGGGVDRNIIRNFRKEFLSLGIPMMTSWNGSDRIESEFELYAGRPDTWGQRSANILIQQSDLVLAIGARLSLQQTGFAWEEFAPKAKVIQVEIDKAEIEKGHPKIDLGINGDANDFIVRLIKSAGDFDGSRFRPWLDFINKVQELLPYNDPENATGNGFVDPYELTHDMSITAGPNDILLPCSSGGAATVSMQTFALRGNQKLVGDKSLASMGYGLSGAIGCALANPESTVFLNEGDGGIAQNLQEFGTLSATNSNVKVFVWANHGYASIRMTQRNYFNGAWIGCDSETGLGLPNWERIAEAYSIPYFKMKPVGLKDQEIVEFLAINGPALIEVPIDPEQTFYPKIMSSVQSDGTMKSNPLHLMSPDLPAEIKSQVLIHLDA